MFLIVFLFLVSCEKEEQIIPDRVVFYGRVSDVNENEKYFVFFKQKTGDEYFLFFEIGPFGDFYKEIKISQNSPDSNEICGHEIGDFMTLRFSSSMLAKDTTFRLGYENKFKFNL